MRQIVRASLTGGILAISVAANAQEATPSPEPLDLSRQERLLGDQGVPTVDEVNRLEAELQSAFDSGDCSRVIELASNFVKRSNALARFIRSGIEPWYNADYDERRNMIAQFLISAENDSNSFLRKRNTAWVMEAECLEKTGNPDEAAVRYAHALEFISIDDVSLWSRARQALWNLLGYKK